MPRGLKCPAKPESLFDRRGFLSNLASTVVGGMVLRTMDAAWELIKAPARPVTLSISVSDVIRTEEAVNMNAALSTFHATAVHVFIPAGHKHERPRRAARHTSAGTNFLVRGFGFPMTEPWDRADIRP